MKRIVMFIDSLGSGGAQRQVVNVARLLKQVGYDVEVLVYRDLPFYNHILEEAEIPIALIDAKNYASRLLKSRRWLNRSHADVVIAFLEAPGFISCFSKIGHKKWKLITTERSAKMETFTSRRGRIYNRFERFSDAKVGNSQNAMRLWRKYYPQYEKKYSVIYNHVAISEEYMSQEHVYLENGKLRVIVAASYQELKNPIRVIEAIKFLTKEQKENLDLHWYGSIEVTTGNTETYDRSVELIREYGLENCISLHQETNDIYRIMAEGDVVGLFSTVEGLPNAVCEGMTVGRPILMSRVSDYDVLVSDNGVLCDPESVESIRDALASMLSLSAQDLERMGLASQKKAETLFSADAITKQWSDLIERLTN